MCVEYPRGTTLERENLPQVRFTGGSERQGPMRRSRAKHDGRGGDLGFTPIGRQDATPWSPPRPRIAWIERQADIPQCRPQQAGIDRLAVFAQLVLALDADHPPVRDGQRRETRDEGAIHAHVSTARGA